MRLTLLVFLLTALVGEPRPPPAEAELANTERVVERRAIALYYNGLECEFVPAEILTEVEVQILTVSREGERYSQRTVASGAGVVIARLEAGAAVFDRLLLHDLDVRPCPNLSYARQVSRADRMESDVATWYLYRNLDFPPGEVPPTFTPQPTFTPVPTETPAAMQSVLPVDTKGG